MMRWVATVTQVINTETPALYRASVILARPDRQGVRIRTCVRACMYICMYVCMYDCMHVCMYACVNVCMYWCVPGICM